ncbi:MAG: DUF2231 domain-containing protein [Aquificaceae bacterium]
MVDIIKIHPPFVHFAIAFPVFLLITHLYYTLTKREWNGLHALLTYLSVLAVIGGTISGIIAHEPIHDVLEKIPPFEVHETLGLFLAPIALVLAVLRFMKKQKPFTVLLIILVLLLLYQGYLGGSVVYDHLIKLP